MLGIPLPTPWSQAVGDTDNAAFSIVGDQLQINATPDFETQDSLLHPSPEYRSGGIEC